VKNRINKLKDKAIERANYYTNINFSNLANEFTELVNILNEMEAIVRERDALKEEKEMKIQIARETQDCEVDD
jgi:hypothetical protein